MKVPTALQPFVSRPLCLSMFFYLLFHCSIIEAAAPSDTDRGRGWFFFFLQTCLLEKSFSYFLRQNCIIGDGIEVWELESEICINCLEAGWISASSYNTHFTARQGKETGGKFHDWQTEGEAEGLFVITHLSFMSITVHNWHCVHMSACYSSTNVTFFMHKMFTDACSVYHLSHAFWVTVTFLPSSVISIDHTKLNKQL